MIKRFFIVLLVLAGMFGGIAYMKYQQYQAMSAQMAKPQPPAVVASAVAEQESWTPYLHAIGSLVASEGVAVTNEIKGQVSAIHFRSGKRVEEGEALIQLEDSVDRAELDGLIAARRLAEIHFERMARLYKRDSVSKSDYDTARAELDAAKAAVTAKRAAIRKKAVRAPFAGLLGIRQVDLGQYLEPGSPIVSLQALDPIYVDYALPEREFKRVHTGQRVELTVQAYAGERFEGTISALGASVDTGTRNIRIRATVENPDGRLRPGMFAEVDTALPERTGVLTVPRTAVTYNPYGDALFVIEEGEDGLVANRRQVETGEVRAGRVEIVSGLEPGERVVRAGHQKLRNGQRIQIDDSVELKDEVGQS